MSMSTRDGDSAFATTARFVDDTIDTVVVARLPSVSMERWSVAVAEEDVGSMVVVGRWSLLRARGDDPDRSWDIVDTSTTHASVTVV